MPIIAALIEVDPETGYVTWLPWDIVVPIVSAAGLAIGAGLLAWFLFKGLVLVVRIINYWVSGPSLQRDMHEDDLGRYGRPSRISDVWTGRNMSRRNYDDVPF
jgi:hypothetical protein